MKTPRTLLMALLLVNLTTAGLALAKDIKDEPGYLDLEWIEIPDNASEIQDIDLTTILKSAARDAAEQGDSDLAEILSLVRSIRVKGFGLDGDHNPEVEKAVEKVTKELKKKDWKRLIYLKDDEEILSVSTKYDGEDLVGLVIMAYSPGDEAMFVNIVGDLDLGTIMSLVGGLDGEGLDEMLEGIENIDIEIDDN